MSSTHFQILEHTIPCQHIREYTRATRSLEDDELQLAVKQYIPIRDAGSIPTKNAVTIIASHANGIPKEAYEPIWDDLLHQSKKCGFEIRSIWMADAVNQGASGVLNEHLLGDDPSYFDHSRDLLQMINIFRKDIQRPIIGIAHSFGAIHLLGLSISHPRLFASLIFMEPVLRKDLPAGRNVAQASTFRPDIWPSHSAAIASIRKSKFYAVMDPRVLKNIIKYSLRKIPTPLYTLGSNGTKEGSYTLTTTKAQEVWTFLRPNFRNHKPLENGNRVDRVLYPDMNHYQAEFSFYRSELNTGFEWLANVRPSLLFIFGGKSYLSDIEQQDAKMKHTGTGLGGNGGVENEEVEKYVFDGLSHMAPLEDIAGCSKVLGEWIDRKMIQFEEDEAIIRGFDMEKSENGMATLTKKWVEMVKSPIMYEQAGKAKL